MNDPIPQKVKTTVKDLSLSDEKIPRNLILMYGSTPYITKAGLEWKANKLFGGAGYSITLDLIYSEPGKRFVFKAVLTVLANGSRFENYGEASLENTNAGMQKNMFHLAITRAECRVLRMATACGYAAYDEVMTLPGEKQLPVSPDGNLPATDAQIQTIRALDKLHEVDFDVTELTREAAALLIAKLAEKK